MTDFRTINGSDGLSAHQSGAWGTPTHWTISHDGEFVCITDSEVDARIMLAVLACVSAVDWAAARDAALRDMGFRRAA